MRIAIIGLGYVGLPLAVELAKHFDVIGVDVNQHRIEELEKGFDSTLEISKEELLKSKIEYFCTRDRFPHIAADMFIITVPTPITESNQPDLSAVKSASLDVGIWLRPGNIVVYESTVYPGVTEEICVPILEDASNLKHLKDFFVGYSPERINPGDKVHTLTSTVKVVSGDNPETLTKINAIYSRITATHCVSSIKVAEAAKVIENTQRDINIAFTNELSQIFTRLGVDTNEVIDAASTKWNFQTFRPGLVGGHCISVDPYYLSHKAAGHGLITDVILAARRVNDSMPSFIVEQLIKQMTIHRLLNDEAKVVIVGCTFKENVPDIRNSKVFKIVELLKEFNIEPIIFDYKADQASLEHVGMNVNRELENVDASAIIYAVPHEDYDKLGWDLIKQIGLKPNGVVMDVKAKLSKCRTPNNVTLWRP